MEPSISKEQSLQTEINSDKRIWFQGQSFKGKFPGKLFRGKLPKVNFQRHRQEKQLSKVNFLRQFTTKRKFL